jgi:geranylgeranyl pyrophosphate synthase
VPSRPPSDDPRLLDDLDLREVSEMVAGDLVDDDGLFDLVGEVGDDAPVLVRTEIPRIRPILVALAARSTGARRVDGQTQVVAELLHLALGAHDMALGRPRSLRRRVARKVIKRSVGWVTGNHLTLRALELSRHSSPEVLEELVDTLRAFSDAQSLCRDLVGELPDEDDWLEHADAHVGALFSFCCRVGALVSGASAPQLSALGRFGRHMGRLWHIAEDVSELQHGDAVGHVIRIAESGRPALPVVHALASQPELVEAWLQLSEAPERADRALAAHVAERVLAGGLHRSREAMLQASWAARRALGPLPDTRYRKAMARLAEGLVSSAFERKATTEP